MTNKTAYRFTFVIVATMIVLAGGNGWAKQFPDLTATALKAKLDSGDKLLLINPLSDIEFNEGHIPGSVNIPLQQIATSDKLPTDKDVFIVTYCLGPK
jgi:rhodanese-related sulfurtransferase